MPGKFVIIDGSSLMHRAFYALPLLQTGSGQYTNAVYGFTTMLCRLLEDIKPDQMAVAFDKGKITFRNDRYAAYKAQRKGTPKELSEQFTLMRDVLNGFGIAVLEMAGFEGDDIIGTVAAQGEKQGYEVIVVTGDRDALQLITDHTKVMLTKKGITDMEMMDSAAVQAKYGVTPAQIVDIKGLMGDSSDNIPGVPGVGEKTATKLIAEYGSVENLLSQVESVSGKKLQETLRTHAESALLSKELATIVCHVPLENVPDHYNIDIRSDILRDLFTKLEFKSLLTRLPSLTGESTVSEVASAPAALPLVRRAEGVEDLLDLAAKGNETNPLTVMPLLSGSVPEITLAGMALSAHDDTLVIMTGETGWAEVLSLLADETVPKRTHDSKKLFHGCRAAGSALSAVVFDTMLAGYLLDPIANDYSLPFLSEQYLGETVPWNDKTYHDQPAYCAWAALTVSRLHPVMDEMLQARGLHQLYQTIEMPLAQVLAEMEATGITVDGDALRTMSADIGTKLEELLKDIYLFAGEEFNVNSTKQLGVILFEKLNLPVIKKTKTGYSTDAEVLEALAGKHEIIDKLLTYRMWTKLKSTYLDGMEGLISTKDRRIHSTFNQTVTATGRLSSSEPNLQNIPIRSEAGKKIRELFVPGQGYQWLVTADYSQIELRVLTHISGDNTMREAFCQNQDIHSRTAAEVFGVPIDQVTSEMRSRAKAVNFGIVYGISDYGLSRDIGVSRKEAATYIENYFSRYPGVKGFMEQVIREARASGYVATLFGRRRYLPDINSSNYNLRSFAERTAMNTPIQGTAADIIKKAMIDVYHVLVRQGLSSRLLLQVHDELVLEVKESELDAVKMIVKEAMEKAVTLDVDLVADVNVGVNWAAAK